MYPTLTHFCAVWFDNTPWPTETERTPGISPLIYEQSAAALCANVGQVQNQSHPVQRSTTEPSTEEIANGRQTQEERDGSSNKPASLAWFFSGCWRSLSFYEHYVLAFIALSHDAKFLGSNQELNGLNQGVSSPLGNRFSFLFSWFIKDRAPRELTRFGPAMTSTRISDVGLVV